MLTKKQMNLLKNDLMQTKQLLNKQLLRNKEASLEGVNARETVGELSNYDNHPADMGTELFEREKDFALEEHADSELNKINKALKAINQGTYGKCAICGISIPFDRLEAVPTTLYCKKHSEEQAILTNRPIEEKILEPAHGNQFKHLQNDEIIDNNDSFQEVARYGTSETPSDLQGNFDSYDALYSDEDEHEGFVEDVESFIATDISGRKIFIYPSLKHKEYENRLNEEQMKEEKK